jgi:hypothetical protein
VALNILWHVRSNRDINTSLRIRSQQQYPGNLCFLLGRPEQGSWGSLSEGTHSPGPDQNTEGRNSEHWQIRHRTDQIWSDQEADQKGPVDQEGAPRRNAVEDTWTSAPGVASYCNLLWL